MRTLLVLALLSLASPAAAARFTLSSADVKPGKVKTVEGSEATITVEGGKVMIDKATVTKTDIAASNGVIHVIDSVILPADLKL